MGHPHLLIPVVVLLLSACIAGTPSVSSADVPSLLTARRIAGVACLGGSALLLRKGLDYHDEADGLYARYEAATESAEAERLFDRTSNKDIKSQVSWVIAGAFAVNGIRLLWWSDDAMTASERPVRASSARSHLTAEPWLGNHHVGLKFTGTWRSVTRFAGRK